MASSADRTRSPLIALGLEPHIEGGYYREWRSEVVLPKALLGRRYSGARGKRLEHLLFAPSQRGVALACGRFGRAVVSPGQPPDAGRFRGRSSSPGVWQTARNDGSNDGSAATLVSCIVSPAFHSDEFSARGVVESARPLECLYGP